MPENLHHHSEFDSITELVVYSKTHGEDLKDIKTMLNEGYITKVEFEARLKPLSWFVYGIMGIVGLGVISAIFTIILK